MNILPTTDIVKLNEDETVLLTGCGDVEEAASHISNLGAHTVLVTLGPKGSWVFCEGHNSFVPGFQVNVVEPIGCGDAFMGAVLTRYLQHEGNSQPLNYVELLTFANAVGALTATKAGVIPALPNKKDVEIFLGERK